MLAEEIVTRYYEINYILDKTYCSTRQCRFSVYIKCNDIQKMEEFADGHIIRVDTDSVVLSIYGLPLTGNLALLKKNLIYFRGKLVLNNLLEKGTALKVKLSNNIPVSAQIDQNIEIIAIFGYIGEINYATKTLRINTYDYYQEIQYNQLLGPDNKVLYGGTYQSYIFKPVILYFNNDSYIIEAKIFNEKINNSYKLEEFSFNAYGKKETEFIVLKDDCLIPHKIHKSRVFYKDSDEILKVSEVDKSIGTEVKVKIENKEIKAYFQRDSLYENRYCSVSVPSTNKSLHHYSLIPNHGKRQKLNSSFFIKEYDELDESSTILISLLEVCYRFPNWPTKSFLRARNH